MNRPRPPPLRKGLPTTGYRPRPRPPPGAQDDVHPVYLYLSLLPILTLVGIGLAGLFLTRLRKRNEQRKIRLLEEYGWKVDDGRATDKGEEKGRRQEVSSTLRNRKKLVSQPDKTEPRKYRPLVVGFWHPYCNAGGGGERVLWTAIAWAQRTHPDGRVLCVVYTGDYPKASKSEILRKVKVRPGSLMLLLKGIIEADLMSHFADVDDGQERFDIPLDSSSIHFVPLPSRHVVSDAYWTRFTLLGQSLGSIWLALQGFVWGANSLWPDIFIDTMGYAFTLPVLALLSGNAVPLGSYIHYPVISTDMIRRVKERKVEGTNVQGISGSAWRTQGKLLYYRIFTQIYATALMFSNVTLTNSTWTQAHIQDLLALGRKSIISALFNFDRRTPVSAEEKDSTSPALDARGQFVYDPPHVVYPPCATSEFTALPLSPRSPVLISLAQFRPEKDQAKQIRALAMLFAKWPVWRERGVRLVLMGSSRNQEDDDRVRGLQELAKDVGVQEQTEFVVNAPFEEIVRRLGQASIGLNTMVDEHFGISVVEFMASLIPLAHASAGPLLDIITPTASGHRTGFHATDAESFAAHLNEILSLPAAEQDAVRRAAREKATEAFAVEVFERGWREGWGRLMAMKLANGRHSE
ncbi:hypothetical protein QFC19_009036 [Naganishia cerealis]|uniref:Uncharacterized protein n=1 Tax=Naganishia cerealis TaxID=610337 RepID=A0ACC2UXF3_9TREE|nr:hypothetical protein QFC19_009036 [Naganishia cerealis]